jgi:putative DNA primase/helicase
MNVFAAMPAGLRERICAADAATSFHGEWPKPQPLPDGLPDVPLFAADLLPVAFRGWVVDVAERMQCPPDFSAVAVMVAAASVIGRQVAIRPKRRDNWMVVPNLWGAVVGRPSLMKSPALHEALMPLAAMEAEAAKQHQVAAADREAAQVVAREAQKINAGEIRKLLKARDPDAAQALARQDLDVDDAPARRRFIINDSTVEKLGMILAANPNGVLISRDELTGFLRAMDREGHEQDRAFYLEAWNGCGRFTVDRVGRGTLDIESCCVSVLGGIQPGPLSEYLLGVVRQGSADDGFIQRFQLAVWPDAPATWTNVDRWPDSAAKRRATEVFRRLASIDAEAIGAQCDEGGILQFLQFDVPAQEVFDDWRADLERRLRDGSEHPAIEAHLAKFRSLVPSLALICHLVDDGTGPVPVQAMTRAAAWAEYLEGHARRLYRSVTHADAETARRLVAKLLAGELPTSFTSWQVWRPGWSGLSDRVRVETAIDMLVELDWLREEPLPTAGRRKTLYRLNPACREVAGELA